ncbi:MAG: glutathione S-transferase C-terminal domain-containing protein [Proteobacteria bacterium]|nr:glutathione S-transferase C-terminal domain-containing protein [Pseudomonadota bacterium]
MKLYFTPNTCALAPLIALKELDVTADLEKVDLGAKKLSTGADYRGVNTKGYVPALDTGKDGVLTEVSTILQYLADNNPAKNLLPKFGDMKRYRAMEMLNFVASELHKTIGSLFNKAFNDDARKAVFDRLDNRIGWLDAQLAKKPYLLGEDYSLADAYAFTVLGWCKVVGYDLGKFANVTAYLERVGARPAVQAALAAQSA